MTSYTLWTYRRNLVLEIQKLFPSSVTHNVDAGDEEGGPGHGRVEHLVREQAVLTVEREALDDAPRQVLQRLRRETLHNKVLGFHPEMQKR